MIIGLGHLFEHAIAIGQQHGGPLKTAPFALLDDVRLGETRFKEGGNDARKPLHYGLYAQLAHALQHLSLLLQAQGDEAFAHWSAPTFEVSH